MILWNAVISNGCTVIFPVVVGIEYQQLIHFSLVSMVTSTAFMMVF